MRIVFTLGSALLLLGLAQAAVADPDSLTDDNAPLWTFQAPHSIRTSPTLGSDGTVYFGADNGRVYALNPDGTERWQFTIGTRLLSSPAIGASGTIYIGSESPANRVYAIKPDGTLAWRFEAGAPVSTTPAIGANETVYAGTRTRFFALDSSGARLWDFEGLQELPTAGALGRDGTIYFGSGAELIALYPDGTVKWRFPTARRATSASISADGTVYVGSFDNQGHLYALDPQGKLVWQVQLSASISLPPVIRPDGVLYAFNIDDKLFAIDVDGTILWHRDRHGPVRESVPAITGDGFLFFLANDSKLYLLAGSGECLSTWPNPSPNRMVTSPVVTPTGTIYLAGIDTLYALRGEHPLASGQWPMLQKNPAHTASIQEETIVAVPVVIKPEPGTHFRRGVPILIEARLIGEPAPQQVLFYANGELIHQTSQPPYQTIWSPRRTDAYSLSAIALSPGGIERESGIVDITVNEPPRISLRTTANPPVTQEFRDLTVIADATDTDGEIRLVEFQLDGTRVAEDTEAPFEHTIANASAGTYTFQARTVDDLGGEVHSAPFQVRVNARPTATIESPSNGDSFAPGEPIHFQVAAQDTDGGVQRVDYFNRNVLLGTTTKPPFGATLFDLPPGKHVLLARAVDETHTGPLSDPVSISILAANQKPQASFLQPIDGARLDSGHAVDLTVVGSDADGQILNLILHANDQQIATFPGSGPHNFQWRDVPPDEYRLTLEAIDEDGEQSMSAISILVGEPHAPSGGTPPRPIEVLPTFPGTDGPIHTVTESNGIIYLGGDFSYLGQPVTGKHVLDLSTEQIATNHPAVNGGSITVAIADKHGGYYVGGLYESIGGVSRQGLARVNRDLTVDPIFKADVDRHILTLLLHQGTLYVGGEFRHIGGTAQPFAAALDPQSGALLPWDPRPDSLVSAFAGLGDTIFIGGQFGSIGDEVPGQGGLLHPYLAAVDAHSGEALEWGPVIEGDIRSLSIHQDQLILGGNFRRVDGESRNGLAAFDLNTLRLQPLNLLNRGQVQDLVAHGNTLFVAERSRIFALDLENNGREKWSIKHDNSIIDIHATEQKLYLSGSLRVDDHLRNGYGVVDQDSGTLLEEELDATGFIRSFATINGRVHGLGDVSLVERVPRQNLAAIDAHTGAIFDWNPSSNGHVNTMVSDENAVYIEGAFSTLAGTSRDRLGAVDPLSGALIDWYPDYISGIREMILTPDRLLLGGSFTLVGDTRRNHLAALDRQTAELLSWNPNANDRVSDMYREGNTLFLAGTFTEIGGQERQRLAALDLYSAEVLDWNPRANQAVIQITPATNGIYVGGGFTEIGDHSQGYLALLDRHTGQPKEWYPQFKETPTQLAVVHDYLFVGGTFREAFGKRQKLMAAIDRHRIPIPTTTWDPEFGSTSFNRRIHQFLVFSDRLYVVGDFDEFGGRRHKNFAVFEIGGRAPIQIEVKNGFLETEWLEPWGWPLILETSTDFNSWTPVQTNTAPVTFSSSIPVGATQQFYRTRPLRSGP